MSTTGLVSVVWECCSRLGHLYTWAPATAIVVSWVPWFGPYLNTRVPITSQPARFNTLEAAITSMDPFQNGTYRTVPMWYIPREIEAFARFHEDNGNPLPCDWAIGCKCYGCNRAYIATLEFWGEWSPSASHDDGRI